MGSLPVRLVFFALCFAAFCAASYAFVVLPPIQRSREELQREAENEALFLAQLAVRLNQEALLARKEDALSLAPLIANANLKEAVLVSLDGRILAPISRRGQIFEDPVFLRFRSNLQAGMLDLASKPHVIREEKAERTLAVASLQDPAAGGAKAPLAMAWVIVSTERFKLEPSVYRNIFIESAFWWALFGLLCLKLPLFLFRRLTAMRA